MMWKEIRLLPLLFLVSLLCTVSVRGLEAADSVSPVRVELVSEEEVIVPGQPFWVGLHFSLDEGWHIYWKNPGEVGFAPEVTWDLPEGFQVGELQWPYPSVFDDHELVGYGYEADVVLLAEITPLEALVAGRNLKVAASISWLACNDSCVPGSMTAEMVLPVAPLTQPSQDNAALFEKARMQLPRVASGSEHYSLSAYKSGDHLLLSLKEFAGVEAIDSVYFFPESPGLIDPEGPQELVKEGGSFTLAIPANDEAEPQGGMLRGVLLLAGIDGDSFALEVQAPLSDAAPIVEAHSSSIALGTLSWYLLLAFLGGAILNLMPCVLPVISLKVLGFLSLAGEDRSKVLRHGVLFSFGVLVSFWALAAVLLILRAYGEGVGWGFQLQEPLFVLLLSMIIFLVGLSLMGVYELGTGLASLGGKAQGKASSGALSTFWSGVLATLVATPCTGPLLAPALGFAVTLSPASSLLFFTVIGLGMAFPYLLLSAFPGWLKWLPKPGAWMVTFKQIMGLLMLATVIWLLWVFDSQVDVPWAMAGILGCLFLLGTAAWIYGRFGTPVQKRIVRYGARLATIVMLGLGLLIGVRLVREGAGNANREVLSAAPLHGRPGWLPWDADRLHALVAEGRPVFVDFTAKWCLICQANKRPLSSNKVKERFEDLGVVTMEADWTRRDPRITSELERFGRTGVPLYVLYSGPESEPIVLPQLLTPDSVLDYLEQIE